MRVRSVGLRSLWSVSPRAVQLSRPSILLRRTGAVAVRTCSSQTTTTTTTTTTQSSTVAPSTEKSSQRKTKTVSVRGVDYPREKDWYNITSSVLGCTTRALHLQPDHPIAITRQIIESHFPSPTYKAYNGFSPAVTVEQNFDSLGFPMDHPGRARSDTYYINKDMLLRTHTSAHQADTFRANESEGYLISADVYRRDAIDRSHYPIFHQMEGARTWDRNTVPNGDIAKAVWEDFEKLPKHDVVVEDPNPPHDAERNPLQDGHSAAEAEAIGAHLKRSLENMVVDIFTRAQTAASQGKPNFKAEPLQMRWIEAYFPFTSPSWELEVYYAGDWLEVLGCGVVKQDILNNAGVPSRSGWAFGLGIDRIAMILFGIPDIRLIWSTDQRFLSQFTGVTTDLNKLKRFKVFSKYPPCPKDVSFWLPDPASSAPFHENDVMEIVRNVAGDVAEDVRLTDEFTHPKTGRKSMAYHIVYRSLEKTLTNKRANALHEQVRRELVSRLGVELR